jgi:hypothetical protein
MNASPTRDPFKEIFLKEAPKRDLLSPPDAGSADIKRGSG